MQTVTKMSLADSPDDDAYRTKLEQLTTEEIKDELDFLGSEPIKIKTTIAQEIYNSYQMFPKVMVWDMRSSKHYSMSHLKWSVNLPVDVFKSEDFLNFNPNKIIDEHLTLDWDKEMFKNRKRSMVFIVALRAWENQIFNQLADLFDKTKLETLKHKYSAEDILAVRNSVLLYMALRKDKTREVHLWRNSFNAIQGKYPFMCKFSGASLYMEPKKSNGYPSEILDRRLYLGDKTHACNETIIHNLGITHILNVSHNIPNTFEESKVLNVKYHRVSIEDNCDVPIELSFSVAFDFIDKAISSKKSSNMRMYQTKFDMVQNFANGRKKSAILVSSAAMMHDIIVDLKKK